LGAGRWQVLQLLLGQGLFISLLGVAAGSVGALFLTRLLASFIYKVSPMDPITFVIVALLLVGVTLVACYVPARRTAQIDPVNTLREE
jgi:putative ABC transport system permease protein